MNGSSSATGEGDVPMAVVRNDRTRRGAGGSAWLIWLVPIVAALVLVALIAQALADRGPSVTIAFLNGHGLKVGDPVIYRGVRVGEVTRIRIASGMDGLEVEARLQRDAASLAQEGSRFWIVRPELSLSRVSGLETLLGPRYIEASPPGLVGGPTSGGPTPSTVGVVTVFRGLEEPPGFTSGPAVSQDSLSVGAEGGARESGLTLILESSRLASTQPGSPVLYRGFKVGQVVETMLSPTGQRVELRVVVQPQYAHLVRKNTRWWVSSGIGIDFGLVGGLSVRTGSLESVISGGVSFATPDRPGSRAVNGDRFALEPEAGKEWVEWSPNLSSSGGGGVLGRPGDAGTTRP